MATSIISFTSIFLTAHDLVCQWRVTDVHTASLASVVFAGKGWQSSGVPLVVISRSFGGHLGLSYLPMPWCSVSLSGPQMITNVNLTGDLTSSFFCVTPHCNLISYHRYGYRLLGLWPSWRQVREKSVRHHRLLLHHILRVVIGWRAHLLLSHSAAFPGRDLPWVDATGWATYSCSYHH